MNEKQQILSSDNIGENMAGVQGLLKKHGAFEGDLALHTQRINQLIAEGQKVSVKSKFSVASYTYFSCIYSVCS